MRLEFPKAGQILSGLHCFIALKGCFLLHLTSLLIFLSLMGCPDTDGDDNDHYDPRNVTRIDDHLEVQPEIVVDSKGNVHIVYHGSVYEDPREVWYTFQGEKGKWSDPVNLSNSSNDSRVPQIAIDSKDNIHVIWEEDGDGNGRTMYTMKVSDGDWSEPIYITDSYNLLPQIVVDSFDNVHVVGDGFRLQYLRNEGGIWLPMENPDTIAVQNPDLTISINGNVFISGEAGRENRIELVSRSVETGLWSQEFITDIYGYPWVSSVTVGENDIVYVSWTVKYTDQIKIRMKYPDGTWSEIDSIPDMEGDPWQSKLAVNDRGLHIVWKAHTDTWDYDIYYQMRTHSGEWKEKQQISLTINPSLDPSIYLKDNVLHIAWVEILGETKRDNIDVYYQSINLTKE